MCSQLHICVMNSTARGVLNNALCNAVSADVDLYFRHRRSGAKSMTYEDLDKVPYAAAVIYEAMRMWPPVTPSVGMVSDMLLTNANLLS